MRSGTKRITAAIVAAAAAVTIGVAPPATADVPATDLTVVAAAHGGHGGHGYGGYDYGRGFGGYRGPGYGYGFYHHWWPFRW